MAFIPARGFLGAIKDVVRRGFDAAIIVFTPGKSVYMLGKINPQTYAQGTIDPNPTYLLGEMKLAYLLGKINTKTYLQGQIDPDPTYLMDDL
jgi:hypothetical protein